MRLTHMYSYSLSADRGTSLLLVCPLTQFRFRQTKSSCPTYEVQNGITCTKVIEPLSSVSFSGIFPVQDFSQKDFDDLVSGWKAKIDRVSRGDHCWGFFMAKKEASAWWPRRHTISTTCLFFHHTHNNCRDIHSIGHHHRAHSTLPLTFGVQRFFYCCPDDVIMANFISRLNENDHKLMMKRKPDLSSFLCSSAFIECIHAHDGPHWFVMQWGPCPLCHCIQNSMEAILACNPAGYTEWLDWPWAAISRELWRIHTGPISTELIAQGAVKKNCTNSHKKKNIFCGCWCNFFHRPLIACRSLAQANTTCWA